MQQNNKWVRMSIAAGAIALLMGSTAAQAATRNMTGSLGVQNPSTSAPFYWEGGPAVLGKKQGVYPPTAGFATIQVAGAETGMTAVGRQVTLAANKMNFAGGRFRDFPAFPNVGQTTKTFMSVQNAATFMAGGGALAGCPGPGCNAAGTAISWCPPLAQPATPAPGTAGNHIGNWDCPAYNNNGGNRRGKVVVRNGKLGNLKFGGTLTVLRTGKQNVWRVPGQPSTPMANNASVERSWMSLMNLTWTPGQPNFRFITLPGNNGPILNARLNGNGAVEATFGCKNGIGTKGIGKTFMGIPPAIGPFVPIIGPGNNCGTATGPRPPGQGWAFKMTTGTISASDDFPFSDETTALGTPFLPHRNFLTAGQGFFFTRMGGDQVVGTVRNLVLLGGSVTVDPGSGNVFNRLTSLRLRMQVPEPTGAAGLLIGAGALLAMARRRR